MSWAESHGEAESLALVAHETLRNGDPAVARKLFERAAQAEASALSELAPGKPRTYGITAVSAVALWLKAGQLEMAERLAHLASAAKDLPDFALDDLRGLLQAIWNEKARQAAGMSFASGQLLSSGDGGEGVTAGAHDALRGPPAPLHSEAVESILRGNLRAVDLDSDWLEILQDGSKTKVEGVSYLVDNLIGPMVNRQVKVRVRQTMPRSYTFLDIELDE